MGLQRGTKVKILEDQFGRIVLQPITEDHVDRVMGSLAEGPDLRANWEKEHRAEGSTSDENVCVRRERAVRLSPEDCRSLQSQRIAEASHTRPGAGVDRQR